MQAEMEKLRQMVDSSDNIVFFGGAGVSTESGIPDFRSTDGVYSQKYRYSSETMLSHTFFQTHTAEFFDFYREKMIYRDAKPNAAHYSLAKLEQQGKLKAVITQNIDGLHQQAGSRNVLELHGSVYRNYCVGCHKAYGIDHILDSDGVPTCECGGVVRPDVVLYEESLDGQTLRDASSAIRQADMLIIGGTSLVVYPAAMLIQDYRGHKLALINRSATPMDGGANLRINGSIGEVLGALLSI